MKKLTKERLNPLNDYLFMKYMGEKGDEEQLIAFLNVVLQKTNRDGIKSIDINEDRDQSADIIGDKSSVLDVRATMDDGTKVNIEVQLRNVGDMDRRSLFYWSREYTKGLTSGQDYLELPNVIAINIINFQFINADAVHTTFHLWEDHHRCLLTDALEIHFIDMVKFRRLRKKNIVANGLHRWLTFFDKNTNNQVVKEILDMDVAIQKAQDKIAFVSQNAESFHAYQMREMALSDFASGINYARRKGIAIGERQGERRGIAIGEQRGIAIGKQQEQIIYALRLSQKGMSVAEVAELVALPVEDVERILSGPPDNSAAN
ncbi:MAG: Rpn family recombination-promoting nuclease/putative transposase [Prevotellaceae bacterium]|jgi:predicted transposase/invertase (TIGR01784 family)|nr:Rpn family recombination-promoting nuclease/putative transposase [Prevotellaceae bacterium]